MVKEVANVSKDLYEKKLRRKKTENSTKHAKKSPKDGETSSSDSDSEKGTHAGPHAGAEDKVDADAWEDAATEVLKYDKYSGHVYWPSDPGRIIGSIKKLREGESGEQTSCYCRLHSHSVIKAKRNVPPMEDLLQWFADGCSLPNGKSGAEAHTDMYPTR